MKEKLKEKLHILGENIRRYREKSDITIQEDPLYLFETDKVLEEETKGVAYGY